MRHVAAAELDRPLHACRTVFASPDLRAAQVSLAVSKTVDIAQLVGLSAYLYDTDGVGAVAAYGVVRAVAPAVGVPLLTATATPLRPGRLLTGLGAAAATAATGITLAVGLGGSLIAVIALAGVVHVLLGAHRPVASALVPTLVRTPEELLAGNAAAALLDGAAFLAGPLAAGLLVGAYGPAAVLYATAIMLSAATFAGTRLAALPGAGPVRTGAGRATAARAFLGTPEVRVITLLVSAQTFVRGALNVVVVVFAVEVTGFEGGAGLLLAAVGVGALAGLPLAYARTGRRLHGALGLGLVLWGLPVALASVAPNLVVLLLLFAVIGLGNDLVDLGAFSALPRAVPERVLPQVLGLFEAVLQLGTAIGAACAGLLLAIADPRVALLATGSVLPIVALIAARRLRSFDLRLCWRDYAIDRLRRQPGFASMGVPELDEIWGSVPHVAGDGRRHADGTPTRSTR